MKMKEGCLKGLRVIDFGQYIAGPAAAMILGDYGADVIHIDPPGGPVWNEQNANAILMRGKRNISLDLKDPDDLRTAKELIASADIVIENFRPGVMERLGLGWEACRAQDPSLIYCSLPGYSASDEKRRDRQGWEGLISADAGLYSTRDQAREGFRFSALPLASLFAAVIACHSIAAALIVREKSGLGQHIESSLYDACFEIDSTKGLDRMQAMIPFGLKKPVEIDNAGSMLRMMKSFPCKDGRYVQITPPPRGYISLCKALFPEEWIKNGPPENMAEILKETMLTRTMREWEEFAQNECGAGVQSALSASEWLNEEHARESRTVIDVIDPILGASLQPGVPSIMLASGDSAGAARHLPDQDRAEILAELNSLKNREKTFGNAPVEPPLKGIKVLDMSQVVAGPTAGRLLAEYGAEVLKINNPRIMDNHTALAGYETQFSGKKTIFLDLKSDEGRSVMNTLIREADIFHSNFSQEAYMHLHYTEEELREKNPEIIVSQVNIHSLGGGREWMRGHEDLGEAVTGMATRYSGTLKPQTLPLLILDHMTGQASALGIILAIYSRMRSGKGQRVQACLSRSGTFVQIPFMQEYEGKVWNEPAGLKAKGFGTFDRIFEAKDQPFYIRASEEQLKAVPEFSAAFAENPDPAAALEQLFKTRFRSAWRPVFEAAGIPFAYCRLFKQDFCGDDYAFARGIAKMEEHPGMGMMRTTHCPPRMSLTPPTPCYPSALPGSDTEEFLKEFVKKHLSGK